jgi:glutathione S-transferase
MITVHHLETSQSFRILWLLEELRMDYDLKVYKRQSDNSAPDEYKKLSPLATAPAITDGDVVLCESNAVIDYILDQAKHSSLRPSAGSPHRTDYLFWFHAAQGTLQANLSIDSLMRIIPTRVPWPISIIARMISSKTLNMHVEPRLKLYLDLAEKQLSKEDYFAGSDLTAADITSIYPIDAAFRRYPSFKETFPECRAWLERVSRRAAFQKALKKTGEEEHVSLPL